MKRGLCVPCAIKLATAFDVKKIKNSCEKITCEECGKRRYGSECEISKKNK